MLYVSLAFAAVMLLSTADSSMIPSQHIWSSGFLRCTSDGMEQPSRLSGTLLVVPTASD